MEDYGTVTDELEAEEPQFDPSWLQAVVESRNIADMLDDDELGRIGGLVCDEFELDNESMSGWRTQMERGLDLAKLVKSDTKDYPFKHASNIKYPLITSAAMQFNARAYPAIVPADRIVKAKTYGSDPQGLKAARGDRIAEHMSWQLATKVDEWEEQTDKLLVQLPIVGTMVRKVWYDYAQKRIRCRLCDPGNFVVNDRVKVLNDAPRASEILTLYPSEIMERMKAGEYLEIELDDEEEGDSQAPQEMIEQHTRIDLDGDEYPEPYIVTVHRETKKVVRIVADFDLADVSFEEQQLVVPGPMGMQEMSIPTGIQSIRRGSYFVDYHFLPSLDGGFHGTGLGLLLGDISESINTIINMMIDAGHMASLGGGFIGSELRLKGGAQRHRPGEYRQVPARGGAVKDSIVELTFPGPDAVLFQMLGLLIEAGREVASVKDVMTGDTGSMGKNASPTTTLAMIEQGMQVFTASYKRIFRSLKKEFKLLAAINAETVSPEEYNAFHDGEEAFDPAQDYGAGDMDIEPVADPRSVTKMQEAAKAQIVFQMAEMGIVDQAEAANRIMQASDIPDREELMPKPNPAAQMIEQMQMKGMEADLTLKIVDIEKQLAEIGKIKSETMKNMAEADAEVAGVALDEAKIKLEAIRDGLVAVIGRANGRMAGAPDNAGAQRNDAASVLAASSPVAGGVLGGQPMAGNGTGFS